MLENKDTTQKTIDTTLTNSQYGVSPISFHIHNGNDAPKLPISSLQTAISLNGKPGGIANSIVLNGRQFNGFTGGTPNSSTIYTLPVNVLYGGGAGTNANFPSGSTATSGTIIFFDTDNGDLGLWLYDLNGWFKIPVNATVTYKNGVATRAGNATSGTQTIAHGLGRVPNKTRITINQLWVASTDSTSVSTGVYNGTTMSCTYLSRQASGVNSNCSSNTTNIAVVLNSAVAGTGQTATITIDATNISLVWTKIGAGSDTSAMQILWEVE